MLTDLVLPRPSSEGLFFYHDLLQQFDVGLGIRDTFGELRAGLRDLLQLADVLFHLGYVLVDPCEVGEELPQKQIGRTGGGCWFSAEEVIDRDSEYVCQLIK